VPRFSPTGSREACFEPIICKESLFFGSMIPSASGRSIFRHRYRTFGIHLGPASFSFCARSRATFAKHARSSASILRAASASAVCACCAPRAHTQHHTLYGLGQVCAPYSAGQHTGGNFRDTLLVVNCRAVVGGPRVGEARR
jgi:hypothetical protein